VRSNVEQNLLQSPGPQNQRERKEKPPSSYSSKTTENKISPAAAPSLLFLFLRVCASVFVCIYIELMKPASQQGEKETMEKVIEGLKDGELLACNACCLRFWWKPPPRKTNSSSLAMITAELRACYINKSSYYFHLREEKAAAAVCLSGCASI